MIETWLRSISDYTWLRSSVCPASIGQAAQWDMKHRMQTSSGSVTRSWDIFDSLRRDSQTRVSSLPTTAATRLCRTRRREFWLISLRYPRRVTRRDLLDVERTAFDVQSANQDPCLNTRDRPLFAASLICTEASRGSLQGSMMYPLSLSLSWDMRFLENCREKSSCLRRWNSGRKFRRAGRGMPNEIETASVRAFIGSVNGDDIRSRVRHGLMFV